MAYNSKAIKTDVNAKPIPQYYNPVTDEYEALQGTDGAARQMLYGPDGQPIATTEGKLAVRAAEVETAVANLQTALLDNQSTAAKQDALAGLIGALDSAAVSDPAVSGTVISLLKGLLSQLQTGSPVSVTESNLPTGAATAAQQEASRAILDSLNGKDYSTAAKQDALAGLVGAIDAAAVSDPAVSGTVISLLKGLLSQLQAGSPVSVTESSLPAGAATDAEIQTLQEKVDALNTKIDGITDGTTPAKTQLTGSKVGVMQSDPVVGERTVTATAAEMHAGTSPLAGRYEMVVLNTSANTVYWGSAGVTIETGFPLLPNDSVHFKFHPETHTAIYFIADGKFTVKAVELA